MNVKLAAAGGIAALLFLSGCSSDSQEATAPATSAAPTESAAASAPAMTEPGTIVEVAAGNPDFETLVAAVTAAGLAETLSGDGPFTVFAPTDAAFAKLPEGTVDSLLKEPQGQLAEILKYHVVAGEFKAADVVKLNGQKIKTVQGGELSVDVTGNTVRLVDAAGNSVNVIATDVDATNGVIHVIDSVLMPA